MAPKCLLLLALGHLLFDISHAADKTVGFRRFLVKPRRLTHPTGLHAMVTNRLYFPGGSPYVFF